MTNSRTRLRILVMVGSLLTLGAATGVAVDRVTQIHGGPLSALSRMHAGVHHDPLGVIESRVELTAEQRERISAILASHQSEVDAAWEEAHARILETMSNVIADIDAELDAEQAEQFRALVEELHGPGGVHPPVSPIR